MTETTKKWNRWEVVPEFFEIEGGTIINRHRIDYITKGGAYKTHIRVGEKTFNTDKKFKAEGTKLTWEVEYDDVD